MRARQQAAGIVAIVRGVFAVLLGIGLLAQRDRVPSTLVTFMGVYWLLAGLVALRWGLAAERRRRPLALAAGTIGVLAGGIVVSYRVLHIDATAPLVRLLGVAILLTGIVNVLGGFEIADVSGRRWRPGVPLGVAEVGLGLTLVVSPTGRDPLIYGLASAWALLGGAVLIADGLRMRRMVRGVEGRAGPRAGAEPSATSDPPTTIAG